MPIITSAKKHSESPRESRFLMLEEKIRLILFEKPQKTSQRKQSKGCRKNAPRNVQGDRQSGEDKISQEKYRSKIKIKNYDFGE